MYNTQQIRDVFSFVFVRNPYARVVSLYNHFRRYGYEEDFHEFLGSIERIRGSGANGRFDRRLKSMSRPMITWTHPPGWPGWTRMFRVENFEDAILDIKVSLGLDSEPVDIDVLPQDHSRRLIDKRGSGRILDLYSEDFELLEYPKDVPEAYQAS